MVDGEGGNWTATDISFDPEDDTRLVYAPNGSNGLSVYDLRSRKTVGPYRNVTNGTWRSRGFEVLIDDPKSIVYTTSDGLRIWDADQNRDAGVYLGVKDGNYSGRGLTFHPEAGNTTSLVFPLMTTLSPAFVAAGKTAHFAAKVVGERPATYSWLLNGDRIPSESFKPIPGDNVVELLLTNVQKSMEGLVELETSNGFASIKSPPAVLKIDGTQVYAFSATDLEWQSETNLWYRVEGFTIEQALGPEVTNPSDYTIDGWLIPVKTPMLLGASPNGEWKMIGDPAEWVRGSGDMMRVIFSVRATGALPIRSTLFRIAVTNLSAFAAKDR